MECTWRKKNLHKNTNKQIQEKINHLWNAKKSKDNFTSTSSHFQIEGNEEADKIAKETTGPPIVENISS